MIKFGRYEIIKPLGTGAMGMVYEAVQTSLNRKVALKILLKKYALDLDYIEDFHREAQHAALLNHENIVTIYDHGAENNEHFIAMELIEGTDLHQVIETQKGLPQPLFLHYARQIAAGVAYAHQKKIVHRDIKPNNIMINGQGVVKIGDFGISRKIEESELNSRSKKIQGTAKYIAPEQIRNSDSVDERADVYALGCVFYEMLTGEPPFDGPSNFEIVYQQLNETVPSDWALNHKVPADLAAVVNRCLQKRPAGRFDDASKLLHALEQVDKGTDQAESSAKANVGVGNTTSDLSELTFGKLLSGYFHKNRRRVYMILVAVLTCFILALAVCSRPKNQVINKEQPSKKASKVYWNE